MFKSRIFRCALVAAIAIAGNSTAAFSQNPGTDSLVGELSIFPGAKYVLRNVGKEINTKKLE